MSNFQRYIVTEQRTYPSIDLTAVPGYVYDFGTLPVPADGRWQSDAGPATGVFDNTIVPVTGNVIARSGGYVYTTSGAPTVGNFGPPMLAYDLTGNTFGCVGSGNPGTWQQLIAGAQSGTYGVGSDAWLQSVGGSFGFAFASITTTDTTTGLPTAATVRWPDGTGGAFTGTIDGGGNGYSGYVVTWTGTTTKTLTASGITYDANGNPIGPTGLVVS